MLGPTLRRAAFGLLAAIWVAPFGCHQGTPSSPETPSGEEPSDLNQRSTGSSKVSTSASAAETAAPSAAETAAPSAAESAAPSAIATTSGAATDRNETDAPPDPRAAHFGESTLELLLEAPTVTAYRLSRDRSSDGREIAHRSVAKTKTPPAGWVRRFRALLTSPGNLDWKREKRCRFDPGFAVGFRDGESELLVVMCFSCSDLELVGADAPSGLVDFTRRRAAFLRLGRELFRDHPELEPIRGSSKSTGEEIPDPFE